jgi:glutathione S-transferase
MSKLKLISFKICPFVQRSVILLKEKGIDYDIEFINPYEPPEWFKEISPTGKVPVLLVDEQPLFESVVINEYLDEINPPSLHPQDPFKKAQNRAWMEYTSPMNMSFFNMIMTKDKEEGGKVKEEFIQQLAGLDKVATNTPWFNGNDFSMVDISAAPVFTRLAFLKQNFDLDLLDGFSNLQRWSKELIARKSVAESMIEDFDELMTARLKDSGSWLI